MKSLELSAPGKVLLFGEWAVLEGYPALATAVSPRFRVRAYPRFSSSSLSSSPSPSSPPSREVTESASPAQKSTHFISPSPSVSPSVSNALVSRNSGSQKAVANAEIPFPLSAPAQGFFSLAATAWNKLLRDNALDPQILEKIEFQCDWKLEEGLGTSSAIVASLFSIAKRLATLSSHLADLRNRSEISSDGNSSVMPLPIIPAIVPNGETFSEALNLLRHCQQGQGSGLDLATQLWGGTVLMQRGQPEPHFQLTIPPQIKLVHTGKKFSTVECLQEKRPSSSIFKNLGESCKKFLKHLHWQESIQEHFEILSKTPLVPQEIQSAQKTWLKNNWIEALKTTGSGGGDALLVFTNPAALPQLQHDLAARGWWMSSYTFQAPGLQVVALT